MLRITHIRPAGHAGPGRIVDTVILDLAQRRARHGALIGMSGTRYEMMLDEPVLLRMGDALELETGDLVEVVAQPEPLIEVRAKSLEALARIAWHLGDRHVPVEALPNRLRLRRDPDLATVLVALGAKIVAIEAPFNPEGGAYRVRSPAHHHGHAHHDHHHGHDHNHDHDHVHSGGDHHHDDHER